MTEEQLKAATLKRRTEQAKIDALKKPPSEQKAKVDNYWYHYKFHTLAGIFVVVLAVFFIHDLVTKVDPDATVVMISTGYVSAQTTDALQTALAENLEDRNEDGKVEVAVDFIQLSASMIAADTAEAPAAPDDAAPEGDALEAAMSGGNAEAEYANLMKMTAILSAGMDPLYLVDDVVYQHLLAMATNEDGTVDPLFISLPENPDGSDRLSVSETILADVPALSELDGLTFCLRVNYKDKEDVVAYYDYCGELLRRLAA
jgi:hypothetical protein